MIFALVLSYLLGSIPTAYVVGRLVKGIDIREHGSGNVGATNVFRVVGKWWGIAVLIFDAMKGFFAVRWIPYSFSPDPSFAFSLLCGIAAISGHTWTIWLKFKGGKGVATSAGVFIALAPLAAGTALLVWACLFAWRRYVSLASLSTALSFPIFVVFYYHGREFFGLLFPISLLLTVFTFYTHRENIKRLMKGEEKKLI